ncbi:hypothetical protein [Asticcacaulis sp.]|uniref:hypothetical protein n=1 Tax=Asticcacaulis sp. TaxID=1872648 RepID=UPI002C87D7E4|nr:hypothetical protein [Asticcacaulis sp.]HTM79775.1 hypothetical protein [Asticcacaulis sp.]
MTYLKLAPYAVIALLLIGVVYFRGEMMHSDDARDAARSEADSLRTVNEQNAKAIERQAAAASANASIMADLQTDLAAIRDRGVTTRTIIQKAAVNDPQVKSWAETPVPPAVRDALRRPDSVRGASEAGH